MSAVFSIVGNTWNIPVEAVERRFPVRIERYELRQDSGGAGQHRGGLGVRRDYRILHHPAELSFLGNRAIVPPWGLDGGTKGAPAAYLLDTDVDGHPASPRFLSKGTMIPLRPNQLVTQLSAGGGGWGDPARRDPERVARDVFLGYVSRNVAEEIYRVAVTDDGRVDLGRTAELRAGERAT